MAAKKHRDQMWTRREMDRAEALRMEGLTVDGIAERLGRSRHSIKGCLKRLKAWKPCATHLWVDVLSADLSDAEVAERMGVVAGAVRGRRSRMRKLGFTIPDRRTLRYRKREEA